VSLVPLLLVSLCTLALAGCTERGREGAPQGPAGRVTELERPRSRLRGHVVLGQEVRTFQPCDGGSELWVVPTPVLRAAYDALSREQNGPVFVELRGELGPPPSPLPENQVVLILE
jgi:hypothetical protein